MDVVAIKVSILLKHPTRVALAVCVDAVADTGCSFPLMCSEETWTHIESNFGDCIEECDQHVELASGEVMRITHRAVVKVILTMNDGGQVSAPMAMYRSNKDLIGLVGLEALGLLVDTTRKCLIRATLLAGCHFAFSPFKEGSQVRQEGPPPHQKKGVGNEFK